MYNGILNFPLKKLLWSVFLLNLLNVSVPENAEPVINYSFGVLILSLLVFFNIVNAFMSLYSLYVINKYSVDERFKNYPRLKKSLSIMKIVH